MKKKIKPAECAHLPEDQKLFLFDADPDTGEPIEKGYECAGCGQETVTRFRAPIVPRRMTGGPRPAPRRYHS